MNPYKKEVEKFINGVPEELEIINLGSTFAKHGFDYKYFGKRGFNFATAPQTLKYDYKILKQYKQNIKEYAIVIIVVCPFGFSVLDYPSDASDYKYYFFLDKKEINNYSVTKGFFIKCFPLLIHLNLGYLVKKLIKKLIRYKPTKNTLINARVEGWKQQFGLSDTITQKPTKELIHTFDKTVEILKMILDLCINSNFRPVIINMPAAKEEYSLFSDAFINDFYDVNINRANIYGVPIINYFGDERFADCSLYENKIDCFNDKGRELFARSIIEDLKKLGMWEV